MLARQKKIIRDWEYQDAQAAFKGAEPSRALEYFPQKEQHDFVTSIEKAWLGLWAGDNKSEDLLEQAKTLDERKFTSVSREAEYFFYSESEDGYIPAEHEIIGMHLISSMYFMETAQWSKARVEAKKAVFYLQNYFPEHQSHFDDPALRIWLAGIWAALGEWGEEDLKTFRFVRFMPSWISMSTEEQNLGALHKELIFQAPSSKTKVRFIQKFL